MVQQAPTVVVAQRLCDLLLSFPAAATGGVRWGTLVEKYEERYSCRLDLQNLGHATPLAAATALLWDVLRLVDGDGIDGPIVAAEDAVALTPRPGSLGCWPSLYLALCSVVRNEGARQPEVQGTTAFKGPCHTLLLSQLKPLLQKHWHRNFEERGLGFLNDDGSFVKIKKMKHLVQALLQWRSQRLAWRKGSNATQSEVDAALGPSLELIACEKHNDLMLCCPVSDDTQAAEVAVPKMLEGYAEDPCCTFNGQGHTSTATCKFFELEEENARLRAENAELRAMNEKLEDDVTHRQSIRDSFGTPLVKVPQLNYDANYDPFDDPFEPPMQSQHSTVWMSLVSPCPSTRISSNVHSGSVTPVSFSQMSSDMTSGSMTPISACDSTPRPLHFATPAALFGFFAAMPAHFGEIAAIPKGIVERSRAQFEPL